jgi:hypothetical protein
MSEGESQDGPSVAPNPGGDPAPLEYQTPVAPAPARVGVGQRVSLGCFISLLWLIGTVVVLHQNWRGVAFVVMFPMGWVAAWINQYQRPAYHVPAERGVIANSIFWGFLIAFTVFRRRRRRGREDRA